VNAFVATSILVRHLTGDPPALAARATAYLTAGPDVLVADLVVAETVYVLESFYDMGRADVADAIRSLVAYPSVVCVDPPLLLRAVEVYETSRVDFSEAYLVACAETTGVGAVASFDRLLDRVGTITRLDPPRP
jgi:predicted nucleic acid-binding protein